MTSMKNIPLTSAVAGSTKCVGCNKSFAATPYLAVTDTVVEIENLGRIDSVGSRHRGHGTHKVMRRWHTSCLKEFEAANEAYRAQVEDDRWAMLRSICEASGLNFDEQRKKYE